MANRDKQRESLSLDEQIRLKMREVAQQRKEEKQRKLAEELEKKRNPLKRGRPELDKEIIQKAWDLAETNSLPDVALKLDVALQSLYNHGINRKAVDEKMMLREKFEPTMELIKTFSYLIEYIFENFSSKNEK